MGTGIACLTRKRTVNTINAHGTITAIAAVTTDTISTDRTTGTRARGATETAVAAVTTRATIENIIDFAVSTGTTMTTPTT